MLIETVCHFVSGKQERCDTIKQRYDKDIFQLLKLHSTQNGRQDQVPRREGG